MQHNITIGLEFWIREPSVIIYACLAIAAFARRGNVEAARIRMRSPRQSPVRLSSRRSFTSLKESEYKALLHPPLEMSSEPLQWMMKDGSDVLSVSGEMNPFTESA